MEERMGEAFAFEECLTAGGSKLVPGEAAPPGEQAAWQALPKFCTSCSPHLPRRRRLETRKARKVPG